MTHNTTHVYMIGDLTSGRSHTMQMYFPSDILGGMISWWTIQPYVMFSLIFPKRQFNIPRDCSVFLEAVHYSQFTSITIRASVRFPLPVHDSKYNPIPSDQ